MAEAKPAALPIFTVAPGRTLVTDAGGFNPGDIVELEQAEGDRLRDLGFLTDEDGSVTIKASGPATTTGDVSIQEK